MCVRVLPQVEERYPGAYHAAEGLRYMTVGSKAVAGALGVESGVEGALAFASYLPLCGDGKAKGDGITPLRCAHLEGAEQREVDAYHIGFVPGVGSRLIGARWYGSKGAIEGWADFLC